MQRWRHRIRANRSQIQCTGTRFRVRMHWISPAGDDRKQAALSSDRPKPLAAQGHPSFESPPSDLGEGLPSLLITHIARRSASASAGDALLQPSRRSVPTTIRWFVGCPTTWRTAVPIGPRASLPGGRQTLVLPQRSCAARSRVILRQPKLSVSSRSRSVWIAAVEGLSNNTRRTSRATREIPRVIPEPFSLSPLPPVRPPIDHRDTHKPQLVRQPIERQRFGFFDGFSFDDHES